MEEISEAVEATENSNASIAPYQGASSLVISDEEGKLLDVPIDDMDIEIRPDGLIYPPQVYWRDKLNQTFGRGQWALIKNRSSKDPDRDKVYYDGSLFVRNCFVSRATGEAEYHLTNQMQSWASVEESAKSDCLGRCCKDLGIFKELWQPNFVRGWIKKYAVKVFVDRNGKKTISWRRIDSEPYWNECGVAADSPNKPRVKLDNTKLDKSESQLPDRNYTDEAEKCTNLEELKKWYGSLTPAEKKRLVGLKNNRKAELAKQSEQSELDFNPDSPAYWVQLIKEAKSGKQLAEFVERHRKDFDSFSGEDYKKILLAIEASENALKSTK